MNEGLKFVIHCLIEEGEWRALSIIASAMGGEVYAYINDHEDCPWN